jgi:hypothetical protein
MEAASSHGAESDRESKSSDSGDSEAASDNFGHLKVMVAAALAGINYNFGLSNIKKPHVGSMESYTHYFPEGYGQPPAQSLCRSLEQMMLSSLRTFSLLSFVCHRFHSLWTSCANSGCNCTI